METMEFVPTARLAVQFIFAVLFGTAAWEKIKGKSAPEWFLKSFESTFISKLPGGARLSFFLIMALESALALAFPLSVFVPALLPSALMASLFLFGALCFGLRITGDYQGSANMFIYFSTSMLCLYLLSR
jgi:hypothetical protein